MTTERKSILCPNCRKLISNDEPACPYCGLARPGLHNTAGIIRNVFFVFDPVRTIIYVNIAYYVLSLLLDLRGIFLSGGPFGFLSPSDQNLFLLGASGSIPVIQYHRFWTLITASFLHGGILHIVFNMMALHQLGPFVLREYGFHRFLNIYILTGVAGFAASVFFNVSFTIGASASICGLIGAVIYYGKSRGGDYGEAIYKQALGWVVGLIVFGIIFSGINNWAHGGGLLSGILLALLLGYNDKKMESAWHKILAYACLVITVGVLFLSAVYAVIYVLVPSLLE
jgi:rhomboid protease GluP